MKSFLLSLSMSLVATFLVAQQMPSTDRPFGWANCTSLTCGDDYSTTGGSALASPRTITLTSHGGDMRQDLIDAITTHDIIVLDGRLGDFCVSTIMRLEGLRHKTIVGINNARVCTDFYVSPAIHQLMHDRHVLDASTTGGDRVFTLSSGSRVHEEREYLIRQTLIDELHDPEESFRQAGLFYFSECQDIIVRNLTLVGPGAIDVGGADLMTCSHHCQHLWIDHCDFIDGMDGNFDINSFSDFITISWCRFSYTGRTFIHANTNLVGSSDNASSNGEDCLNVTFAFCEWGPGCDQRMPMARFGTIHLLHNYYNCPGNSAAVNPRYHAQFLIEGNYFGKGITHIFSCREPLSYVFRRNHYSEAFEQPADLGETIIPYAYPTVNTVEVPVLVGRHAGATLLDPLAISF